MIPDGDVIVENEGQHKLLLRSGIRRIGKIISVITVIGFIRKVVFCRVRKCNCKNQITLKPTGS